MSVLAAENGRAYALTDDEWIDYLATRARGAHISLEEVGIGVGDFVADVTALTPTTAAGLLADAKGALLRDAA